MGLTEEDKRQVDKFCKLVLQYFPEPVNYKCVIQDNGEIGFGWIRKDNKEIWINNNGANDEDLLRGLEYQFQQMEHHDWERYSVKILRFNKNCVGQTNAKAIQKEERKPFWRMFF